MNASSTTARRLPGAILGAGLLVVVLLAASGLLVPSAAGQTGLSNQATGALQLPLVQTTGAPEPLCRFGVNVTGDLGATDTAPLRVGWFVDYTALPPFKPQGIEHAPIISLKQVGDSYTYSPKGADLTEAITSNPGALWFIGNEPDRPRFQNDIEPHLYAQAYHDLYGLIKAQDPTARIIAGTIVQPTPVRLTYLDMVLDAYIKGYGQALPADGWSIHNFILNEVSCDYDPSQCWGAEIPPGVDVPYGEVLSIEDNDNFDLFVERIWRFRRWMAARGYAGLPLYLSEYGILMPEDYGFSAERVNAFMSKSFDFLRTARDTTLGDPTDGYRLVQQWSWYSTLDPNFNGMLYDPVSFQLTAIGRHFAGYTPGLANEVDLYPVEIMAEMPEELAAGQKVDLTLRARISNAGNLAKKSGAATVRFYRGDPRQGGTQIGPDQTVSLAGCGQDRIVGVTWEQIPKGTYRIYVSVDVGNKVGETNEANNIASTTVFVPVNRMRMPSAAHSGN